MLFIFGHLPFSQRWLVPISIFLRLFFTVAFLRFTFIYIFSECVACERSIYKSLFTVINYVCVICCNVNSLFNFGTHFFDFFSFHRLRFLAGRFLSREWKRLERVSQFKATKRFRFHSIHSFFFLVLLFRRFDSFSFGLILFQALRRVSIDFFLLCPLAVKRFCHVCDGLFSVWEAVALKMLNCERNWR